MKRKKVTSNYAMQFKSILHLPCFWSSVNTAICRAGGMFNEGEDE